MLIMSELLYGKERGFIIHDLWISKTPFVTHSCGQRANHQAMIHPPKAELHQMNGITQQPTW